MKSTNNKKYIRAGVTSILTHELDAPALRFGGMMAKRFTDTDKWKDNWYLSLSNDNRLVWQWLLDNCEHSGVIKRGVVAINLNCRTSLTEEKLIEIMEGRLIISGGYYFIPKFLKFQYSAGLNSDKPVIKSVRNRLNDLGVELLTSELYGNGYLTIRKRLRNRCLTIKDKDKDKDSLSLKTLKDLIQYGEFVKMTDNQYKVLCEKHTQETIDGYIERVNDYMANNKKARDSYSDFPAVIRTWLRTDKSKRTGTADNRPKESGNFFDVMRRKNG